MRHLLHLTDAELNELLKSRYPHSKTLQTKLVELKKRATNKHQAEAKGSLTEEQLSMLKTTLIDYITTKTPEDLPGYGHAGNRPPHPWFIVNNRKQKVWNWRQAERPLRLLADHFDLTDQYCNTSAAVLHRAIQSVKNCKAVKAIKDATV